MWAKHRSGNMTEFAAKAKEFGFSYVEVDASVSPQRLAEPVQTSMPISSIHSPAPTVLSSEGIPVANLSLSSKEEIGDAMIGIHLHDVVGISDHRPTVKGELDWNMVAEYLPHEATKVCEIAEWNEAEQIQGVVSFLQEQIVGWLR